MTKEFNNLEELEPYYDKETNTYIFWEDREYIDVKLNFDLTVKASINASNIDAYNIDAYDIYAACINAYNIDAWDIYACNIHAWDINACNITAWDIKADDIKAGDINAMDIKARDIKAGDIFADDISYYAVCISYKNIICESINGNRDNCFYKALDGEIIIKEKGDK